jgi:hypothetical protein
MLTPYLQAPLFQLSLLGFSLKKFMFFDSCAFGLTPLVQKSSADPATTFRTSQEEILWWNCYRFCRLGCAQKFMGANSSVCFTTLV